MKFKFAAQSMALGLISFLLYGCSQNTRVLAVSHVLDSLKAAYAPDPRTSVFNVNASQTNGHELVVKGAVDNPEAKKSILLSLKSIGYFEVIDSVTVLPDTSLGKAIFGIVNVSVGNMRAEPHSRAELVNQVLLGHIVKVLEKRGGWLYIKSGDNYLGWIDAENIVRIDSQKLNTYLKSDKLIVTAPFTILKSAPDNGYTVSDAVMACYLKLIKKYGMTYMVQLPDGRTAFVRSSDVDDYSRFLREVKPTPENVKKLALSMLGFPYLWGGTSTKGMDCSGFTKTVYRMVGIDLPRDADQQALLGKDVSSENEFAALKIGDLLFFGQREEHGKKEKIVHVGIYIGSGYFIHSSGRVRISSLLRNDSLFDEYNLNRFVRAKRILNPGLTDDSKSQKDVL
ncbi:MAG: NlpC/P60 family protein [Candidatus Kryptoniota bacterium]